MIVKMQGGILHSLLFMQLALTTFEGEEENHA